MLQHVTGQSWEIGRSVDPATNKVGEQGAGDQGIVFGYATAETPERLPLTLVLAHALSRGLAEDRRSGQVPWLRPDGKTQVSVVYEDGRPAQVTDVLVSTQHAADVTPEAVRRYVAETLAPRALGAWHHRDIRITVNPSGSFVKGGPAADCGVTGRKIIVDTYGGAAHHGGGAFSGKDPSKVDRSGAYFCRYVARHAVDGGPRGADRDPGRVRDRRGRAGRGPRRHVRHRRSRRRARPRARLRLPAGRDRRAAAPAAAALPAHHQLRALRQAGPALGVVG